MYTQDVVIQSAMGFHVRPAQLFVERAAEFASIIKVKHKEKVADGKSILGLMTLGVLKGDTITIMAEGKDEEAAIKALVALLESECSKD